MSAMQQQFDGNDTGLDGMEVGAMLKAPSPVLDPDQVTELAFAPNCRVNTPDDVILDQVATNIRRGLEQARPYAPNQQTAALVCGGPSLNDPEIERALVKAFWAGEKVVCVNGSYDWCIRRNIRPAAMVLMDARKFNARFVERPVDECTYMLASECHPDAFEFCRGRKVKIWHALSAGEEELAMLDEYYFERRYFHPVTLGTTVSLRAISLLRMMGFINFNIFGMDSCVFPGEVSKTGYFEHHAYAQPENDGDKVIPVWLRPDGRDDLAQRFLCTVWQAKQASDFVELLRERGDLFNLRVHGPGILSAMLQLGINFEGQVHIGEPGEIQAAQ